ncbi:MAG: NAD(+) synthase [Lentisphaerae bacterium]|nr:NAD(+) synthase [Lentisphaerota bacterium]
MHKVYRIAAAVPVLEVANPRYNAERIIELYLQAQQQGASIVVMPELALTGYSCGDLFEQKTLLEEAKKALLLLEEASSRHNAILIVGVPFEVNSRLYNTAAVIQNGRLRALVGKTYLPEYRAFYEKRQFRSIREFTGQTVCWKGEEIPFGGKLVFQIGDDFSFGIEICEDLWAVTPPPNHLAQNGAQLIFNLSATPELVTKAAYRRDLVKMQSAKLAAAYVLSNAGVHESTSDLLFSGQALIAANGKLLAENTRFERTSSILYADLKPDWMTAIRRTSSSFNDQVPEPAHVCKLDSVSEAPDWTYFYFAKHPFVPASQEDLQERCREIFAIQSSALAKRIEHIHSKRMVIGISGGLDSTLALLVCAKCCDLLQLPRSTLCAITMPGFGTTDRTLNNAGKLAKLLGAELRTICIRKAVEQHFKDIGHDKEQRDLVYENSQARERTQILMDIANAEGGLVIGTGDLSEIALGWNTFNGDHMSMYCVNAGVPKTLIRPLIETQAQEAPDELANVLLDINNTPVSPELLPGEQHTESIIGSYNLHDFFLYYFLKYGESPRMLKAMALHAFEKDFTPEEIERTLKCFIRRFFTQQFKRNAMPDGPKVGTIALSPRGDWRMPADADHEAWMQVLNHEPH